MDTNNKARKADPITTRGFSGRRSHPTVHSQWRSRWQVVSLALNAFIIALAFWLPAAHADDVAYVYDELGRLVQASNATSEEAVLYAYDAAGNITSQRTIALTTLAIGHFAPGRGPVGAQVTISGTGFNAVPAANIVRFNGTAATVVSASQTQIVAIVPASATTGPVNVEVGAETATSSNAFVVTATNEDPTITAVLPNVGTAGIPITVVGTNFEALPSLNRVRLNSSPAQVTGSAATTISMLVPANTGSGRIRVTTPRGVAISPTDFVVVPVGYGAGQIASTGRIETDGAPAAVVFPSTAKIGLRLFEGVAGELLTIGVSSTTLATCTIKVFGPDAALLVSGAVTAAGQGVQLPKLPKTGTYTMVVDAGATTGSISLGVFKPLTGTVTLGGGTTVSLAPPGRRALLTFSGTQGIYASIALSGVTLPSGKVSVFTPAGAELASNTFTTSGALLQPLLPRTGTYVVLIDPTGSVSGSATLSVAASSMPALTPNTGAYTVNLTNSTQVSLTFRGEPGQYMSIAAFVEAASAFGASVVVRNPDGSQLATKTVTTSYTVGSFQRGSRVVNIGPLQYGGTYTAVVQRTGSVSGSVELTLTTALMGSLSSDGVTSDVGISMAGQSVLRSFSATAGEILSFAVGERTGFITGADITVLNPDGSVLRTDTFAPPLGDGGVFGGGANVFRDGGKVVNLGPLPVTGTYRVLLQQVDSARKEDDYTGTLKLTLAKPLAGTIAVDGATTITEIGVVGQGLRYTFQGIAGQRLALGMSSNAGTINAATATVLDPNGVPIAAGGMVVITSAGGDLVSVFGSTVVNIEPLATSGTYTIVVQQAGSKALSNGNIVLTLSTPLMSPIGTSGSASNLEIIRPGQGVLFSYSGTASEYLV